VFGYGVASLICIVVRLFLLNGVTFDAGVYAERVTKFESIHGPELAAVFAELADRGWLEVAQSAPSRIVMSLDTIAVHTGENAAVHAATKLPRVSIHLGADPDALDRLEATALAALQR
jgi:hypothetical protein